MGEENGLQEASTYADREVALIAFHGAPVSGAADAAMRFYAGRHVLVSFAYPKHLPIIAKYAASFVLDCGAYTIWRRGGTIDPDAYMAWVAEWDQHPAFAWAVIPDVIDGDEEANQRLLSRCLNRFEGVPVWHLHESIGRLKWMCGAFRRVALGSSGEWSRPGTADWWERMNDVMAAICDGSGRPRTKLHGLRMLAPKIIRRLPLSSADSTNAARNGGDPSRGAGLAAWQRATAIAWRIEGTAVAERWRPVTVRQKPSLFDSVTALEEATCPAASTLRG